MKSLQLGQEIDPTIDIEQALKDAEHQSVYAQSIRLGYDFLIAAYLEGKSGKEALVSKLKLA